MPVIIPVLISLPAMTDLRFMIFIPIMKSTTRQMAGTTPMVLTTTEAGTVVWKVTRMIREVLALRRRMIRNACAVLMCSRGTPMFLSGDEFGNTKFGNNNSYCQDNITSWLDWRMLEKNKDLFEFFKFMIAFRKQHPVIHKQLPTSVCGMDSIHTHNVNADQTDIPRDARTFCVSFAGYDKEKGHDDLIYIAVNTFWEDVTITLPDLHGRGAWHLNVNTYGDGNGKYCYPDEEAARIDRRFVMRPRSVAVFTGKDY